MHRAGASVACRSRPVFVGLGNGSSRAEQRGSSPENQPEAVNSNTLSNSRLQALPSSALRTFCKIECSLTWPARVEILSAEKWLVVRFVQHLRQPPQRYLRAGRQVPHRSRDLLEITSTPLADPKAKGQKRDWRSRGPKNIAHASAVPFTNIALIGRYLVLIRHSLLDFVC